MIYNVCLLFMLFFIYSFIGWLIEVIKIFIEQKKLVNRGFLIGPICPIYGYGAILLVVLLTKYESSPVLLFIMAMLISGILEYLTSVIMEKLFKARWWDYSHRKFNFNGRVCLDTMLPFGILGTWIVYFINPFFFNILEKIPSLILEITALVLLVFYLIDNIISTTIIYKFKNTIKHYEKDNTIEISKKVNEIMLKKSFLYRRLVKAFPNFLTPLEYIAKMRKKLDDDFNRFLTKSKH